MSEKASLGSGAAAGVDQIEISVALKQFLDLFKADCNQFKIYMASNCAVDWFGRTIRGPTKIHDYLTNEVCSQYKHINFEKVQACDAIEYKPTHMKTKIFPSGDVDYTLPINKVSGITSLKLFADSDVEDEDYRNMESSLAPEVPSPTSALMNSSAAITPPTSSKKDQPSGSETEESESEDFLSKSTGNQTKCRKRRHSPHFSYLRRFQSTVAKRRLINDGGIRALMFDRTTDDEAEEEDAESQRERAHNKKQTAEFSELKYFEVTGVLQCLKQHKDQDVDDTRSGNTDDTTASCWDRPVRLRISFRVRSKDQQIQFALIIYEHPDKFAASSMSAKKNLMLEFTKAKAKVGGDDDNDDYDEQDEVGEDGNAKMNVDAEMNKEIYEVERQQQHLRRNETLTDTEFLNSNELPRVHCVMLTPTKFIHTPPATPTRKPRLPQSLSSLRRGQQQHPATTPTGAAAATPSPKRSAARSLRL